MSLHHKFMVPGRKTCAFEEKQSESVQQGGAGTKGVFPEFNIRLKHEFLIWSGSN